MAGMNIRIMVSERWDVTSSGEGCTYVVGASLRVH